MRTLFDLDIRDVAHEIEVRQNTSRYTMRPYQADAVDAVFREWDGGAQSTMVCLPTGGGKTVVFAEVMRQHAERNR